MTPLGGEEGLPVAWALLLSAELGSGRWPSPCLLCVGDSGAQVHVCSMWVIPGSSLEGQHLLLVAAKAQGDGPNPTSTRQTSAHCPSAKAAYLSSEPVSGAWMHLRAPRALPGCRHVTLSERGMKGTHLWLLGPRSLIRTELQGPPRPTQAPQASRGPPAESCRTSDSPRARVWRGRNASVTRGRHAPSVA